MSAPTPREAADRIERRYGRDNLSAEFLVLVDHARPSVVPDEEQVARLRGKVYAALLDEKPIRTLFGRRWLDGPEAERIAAAAVSAVLGIDGYDS